jgi:GNAT superfamily N-acetyltransferase
MSSASSAQQRSPLSGPSSGRSESQAAPPGLLIRDYEPADHATLVELNRYGLAAAGVPEDGDIYGGDLDDIAGSYLSRRGAMLVGAVGGEVVAMGGLWQVDALGCEILRMRVRPIHQGKGFARALLGALEDRARQLGYETAALVTGPDQHPAIDLYLSSGYVQGEVEHFGELIGVRLVKQLRAGSVRLPGPRAGLEV